MTAGLTALVDAIRAHPGVTAKAEIGLVAEVFGAADHQRAIDDGTVVPRPLQPVGGEAILPAFVATDPFGAGVAAVTTNLNDLAAMGAWPLALVDTVTGPRPVMRSVLEGMRWAAGVPLREWVICFPCFAFLLCVPPDSVSECLRAFAGRGLAAAAVGTLDATGQVRVRQDGQTAVAFDLTRESVTNLR